MFSKGKNIKKKKKTKYKLFRISKMIQIKYHQEKIPKLYVKKIREFNLPKSDENIYKKIFKKEM